MASFLKNIKKIKAPSIIAAALFIIGALLFDAGIISEDVFIQITGEFSPASFSRRNSEIGGGKTRVHFIDTDQSECILITTEDKTVLIDAAEKGYGNKIKNYIDEQGISEIDLFIVTHPHSDHIGSAVSVFENFEVKEFLMSDIADDSVPTTSLYENMLKAAEKEGCRITLAKSGLTFKLDDQTELQILGPVSDYGNDYNNVSIVSKLVCKNVSFLLTGDEEKLAEKDLLASGADVSCTVYKAAHHGSTTSNSDAFLEAASPDYAVILCGAENDYGHPHKKIVDSLREHGCKIYRTDLDGSIIFSTDGETLDIATEK